MLETSSILTGLLDLVVRGEIQLNSRSLETSKIASLARKYDFQLVLKQMALHARSELSIGATNKLALEVFLMGAALDDRSLCLAALQSKVPTWDGDQPSKFGSFLRNGHTLDPASAALDDLCSVTPEILWAWMRAYRHVFGPPTLIETDTALGQKARKMSQEFGRLLSLEGRSTVYHACKTKLMPRCAKISGRVRVICFAFMDVTWPD